MMDHRQPEGLQELTTPNLILVLVDPKTSKFELLQLNIQKPKATIQYVLRKVIKKSSNDSHLATLKYDSVCDYDSNLLDTSTRLVDIPLCHGSSYQNMGLTQVDGGDGEDDSAILTGKKRKVEQSPSAAITSMSRSEILIALPSGSKQLDCLILARTVLSHQEIVDSLELQGIDTSALLTLDSYSDDEASLVSDDGEYDPLSLGDAETKLSRLGLSFTAKKIAQDLLSKSWKETQDETMLAFDGQTMLTFERSKQNNHMNQEGSKAHFDIRSGNKKHRGHPWSTMAPSSTKPSASGWAMPYTSGLHIA